jgi:hypothetical protein
VTWSAKGDRASQRGKTVEDAGGGGETGGGGGEVGGGATVVLVVGVQDKLRTRLLHPLLDAADRPPAPIELRRALATIDRTLTTYITDPRLGTAARNSSQNSVAAAPKRSRS